MILGIQHQCESNSENAVLYDLLAFSYASLALRALASASTFSLCSRSALRSSFCSVKEGVRVRREGELGTSVDGFRTCTGRASDAESEAVVGTPSVVEWLDPLEVRELVRLWW
jgi:hypothetical protein